MLNNNEPFVNCNWFCHWIHRQVMFSIGVLRFVHTKRLRYVDGQNRCAITFSACHSDRQNITSNCSHLMYIETVWNEVRKWPNVNDAFSANITIRCDDYPFGLPCGCLLSPLNIRWCWCTPMCHWLRDIKVISVIENQLCLPMNL